MFGNYQGSSSDLRIHLFMSQSCLPHALLWILSRKLLLIANRETRLMFQVLLVHASPFLGNKRSPTGSDSLGQSCEYPRLGSGGLIIPVAPPLPLKCLYGLMLDNPTWERRGHASNTYYRKAQSYCQKYRCLISQLPKADAQSPKCRVESGGSNNLKRPGRESSVTCGVGSRENLHRTFNLMTRTEELVSHNAVWVRSTDYFQNNPTS